MAANQVRDVQGDIQSLTHVLEALFVQPGPLPCLWEWSSLNGREGLGAGLQGRVPTAQGAGEGTGYFSFPPARLALFSVHPRSGCWDRMLDLVPRAKGPSVPDMPRPLVGH